MTEQAKLGFSRSSSSPLAHLGLTGAGDDDSFCHPPTKQVPDGIKMPQSKLITHKPHLNCHNDDMMIEFR